MGGGLGSRRELVMEPARGSPERGSSGAGPGPGCTRGALGRAGVLHARGVGKGAGVWGSSGPELRFSGGRWRMEESGVQESLAGVGACVDEVCAEIW